MIYKLQNAWTTIPNSKKRILQRPGHEVSYIEDKPSNTYQLQLPEFKFTPMSIEESVMSGLTTRKAKDAYNAAYNEYVEQHPVSTSQRITYAAATGPIFPGDASFSNFSMDPINTRNEEAYKYAVEKSSYDPGNPNDIWRYVDSTRDKVGAQAALLTTTFPALLTASTGALGIIPKLAADLKFAYDGYKGLTSPEGWAKTKNFLKEGRYGRAAWSGLGDLFDASLMTNGLGTVIGFTKPFVNKFGRLGREIYDTAKFNFANKGSGFRMDYPWQVRSNAIPNGTITLESIPVLQGKPLQLTGHFAKIKYYGPTMGKSYAAKINSNLIDLDTYGMPEYDQLARKYGYKDWREMILSDKGDYNEEYKKLIKQQIYRLQTDPNNAGKTILVSNASLLKPNSGVVFDAEPVIPERSVMALRNHQRHPWESIQHGEEWWDSLMSKGTPLKIDNRYVSEIEKLPYQSPTTFMGMYPRKAFAVDFSGVENVEPGNFGYGGAKPNFGLRKLFTERRAKQLLDSATEERKRNASALNWTGKDWNDLSYTDQYWLKVNHGNEWNDKLIISNTNNSNKTLGISIEDIPSADWKYNPVTGDFNIKAPKRKWINIAEQKVADYYDSPQEYERLLASGATPDQANLIMAVRQANVLNALPSLLRRMPADIYGHAENIEGRPRITYNNRNDTPTAMHDFGTALNDAGHELGGHGATLNIGSGLQTIPENEVEILMKIFKHNEALKPQLRPVFQAIKDGDIELAKTLSSELPEMYKTATGELNVKEIQDMIAYMEDVQEYMARGSGANISNHYGYKNGWNESQLRKFFTDESVDNLLKNMWSIIPITALSTIGLNNIPQKQE